MLDFGDMGTSAAFERLFRTVLLRGAFLAAQVANARLPRRFRIDVVGGERPGRFEDVAAAGAALGRSDGLFYPRIDLAVGCLQGERARAIAYVVPGQPCAFERTWNKPRGYGPFRVTRWEKLASLVDERRA